jgi:hypothetical protein
MLGILNLGALVGDGKMTIGKRTAGLTTNIGALVGTTANGTNLGALVGVGSALAGAGSKGVDSTLGTNGTLGANGTLGDKGEPGVDGALADGALAVDDGAPGGKGAGADGAFGALGAVLPPVGGAAGAVGDVRYFWQQRSMRRPREIKRRQNFLPRLVLQTNADDGELQASNTVNAKNLQDERIVFILLLGVNEILDSWQSCECLHIFFNTSRIHL